VPGARRRAPEERRRGPKVYGSAAFVTGAFGLAAAAAVVQRITGLAPRTHRILSEKEEARRRKRPRGR
jgi:tRNA A37 threonylcarbamoyladenosine dehydratase